MARPPKVLLFDIGGVCVISPFQTILDYELGLGIPPGWINYSLSKTAPDGFWHRLEKGAIPMDAAFFAGFNRDLHDEARWRDFYASRRAAAGSAGEGLLAETPPVPTIDGERLFNDMMAASQAPDPWMLPALRRLRASGRFVLAALSNTVIFPEGHALRRGGENGPSSGPLSGLFDVFVSSAHVGLRKPDPRIYRLALERADEFARSSCGTTGRGREMGWAEGVAADEVVFLDDIGENLKAAKKTGFQTIKVPLGRAFEAVEALEKVTGLQLAGDHPKVPIGAEPRTESRTAAKAKI